MKWQEYSIEGTRRGFKILLRSGKGIRTDETNGYGMAFKDKECGDKLFTPRT